MTFYWLYITSGAQLVSRSAAELLWSRKSEALTGRFRAEQAPGGGRQN